MEPELLSLPLPPQVLNLFIRQLLSHIYFPQAKLVSFLCFFVSEVFHDLGHPQFYLTS